MAGAVATQLDGWANQGSIVPSLGASGAIAASDGSVFGAFPKVEDSAHVVVWLLDIRFLSSLGTSLLAFATMVRIWRFITGKWPEQSDSVAHWAHVGGFRFGALAALGLRYSGLEHRANKAIEEKDFLDARS